MIKIQVEKINKSFNNKTVIKNVSFKLDVGIYGLVGANGSGKTTLIKMITGLLEQDSGAVYYNGKNVIDNEDFRSVIGFMPQSSKGYSDFTGEQFLYYMASLKDLKKDNADEQIKTLVNVTNLENDIHKKVKEYSGGMRQRLMLIQALLGDPKVLILDEPTAGLDPLERINVRNYISEFAKGKIIIIATHVMQDIEAITKNLILLHNHEIKYFGDISSIITSMNGMVFEKRINHFDLEHYQENYKVSNIINDDEQYLIRYISKDRNDNNSVTANLEEVYLHYLVD